MQPRLAAIVHDSYSMSRDELLYACRVAILSRRALKPCRENLALRRIATELYECLLSNLCLNYARCSVLEQEVGTPSIRAAYIVQKDHKLLPSRGFVAC